jgi:hypothetical protein
MNVGFWISHQAEKRMFSGSVEPGVYHYVATQQKILALARASACAACMQCICFLISRKLLSRKRKCRRDLGRSYLTLMLPVSYLILRKNTVVMISLKGASSSLLYLPLVAPAGRPVNFCRIRGGFPLCSHHCNNRH